MMPQINLEPITEQLSMLSYIWHNPITGKYQGATGIAAAMRIIATQGKNKGRLRASKPPMHGVVIERERYGYVNKYHDSSLVDCAVAQVWRYVAFEASPVGQHQCLPVMADFDAPFDMSAEESRQFAKWCQSVADVILTTIKDKPGLDRWGRALGYF